MIGTKSERDSGKSVLARRLDDDENLFVNQFSSLLLLGKFLNHFVAKSISTLLYLHLLQEVFIHGNENQIT